MAGLGVGLALSLKFAGILSAYVALTVAYTLWLKHQPVLDIAVVASGFVFRAVAGGVATTIPLSQWFLIVTAAGSLFIVAGKRHAEFVEMGEGRGATRTSLLGYSLAYLRYVWMLASAVGIVAYCLWAFEQSRGRGFPWFELSIVPFVIAILHVELRFARGQGGAPEEMALRDRTLQVLGAVWVALVVVGIYS